MTPESKLLVKILLGISAVLQLLLLGMGLTFQSDLKDELASTKEQAIALLQNAERLDRAVSRR